MVRKDQLFAVLLPLQNSPLTVRIQQLFQLGAQISPGSHSPRQAAFPIVSQLRPALRIKLQDWLLVKNPFEQTSRTEPSDGAGPGQGRPQIAFILEQPQPGKPFIETTILVRVQPDYDIEGRAELVRGRREPFGAAGNRRGGIAEEVIPIGKKCEKLLQLFFQLK